MTAPCLAVPLPGGRPVPSGRTSMFQPWRSASAIGRPRPGVWAAAVSSPNAHAKASSESHKAKRRSCIDMLDLPFAVDAPAGDAVVVLIGKRQRRRDRLLGLAARR